MNDDTLAKVKAIIDGVPNQKKLAIIKERIAVVTKRRTMLKGDKGDKGGDGIAGAIGKDGAKGDAGTKGIDGAKGADGLRGATGEAGRVGAQGAQGDVGINWLGDWRRGTVYSIGDLVRIGEDVYLCIVANANEPAGLIGWIKLSQRGARGAQGAGGFRGEAGAAGTSGSSAAKDLTGATLAENVVASSLTSVGTLGALKVDGNSLTPAKITSRESGAAAGPILNLERVSASPAINDVIGSHVFRGRDALGSAVDYAAIEAVILNPDDTSLAGQLQFNTSAMIGGIAQRLRITDSATAASATNATVVVTGGLGVSGPSYFNGTVFPTAISGGTVNGATVGATTAASGAFTTLTATATTASSSSTTGALVVSGGVGIAKDSWVNGVRIGIGAAGTNNTVFGVSTGGQMGAGADSNTMFGFQCQFWLSTGDGNTGLGSNCALNIRTGSWNSSFGINANYTNQSGSHNTGVGLESLFYNTNSNNTGIGSGAGYNLAGASTNGVIIGYNAGKFHADGATALTASSTSVYLGSQCRGKDNSDANTIVIGAAAVGLGANTTVIGTTSTTSTTIQGTTTSALITAGNTVRIVTTKTPATAGAAGTTGDIVWDANYIYVCTATNTWKRSAIATW